MIKPAYGPLTLVSVGTAKTGELDVNSFRCHSVPGKHVWLC